MSSPLSPNVTRAVVRDVLVSKSAVLDAIMAELVACLTPVVAEHAAVLVHASIDPDPRESLIDDLTRQLGEVVVFFANLNAHANEDDLWEELWSGVDSLERRLTETLMHLHERRARMRGVEIKPPIPAAAEGGAS